MNALNRLAQTLQTQINLQREILMQVKNMYQAIMAANVQQVEAIQAAEEKLAVELRKAEIERRRIIRDLAQEFQFDPDKTKLPAIIEMLDSENAATLSALRQELVNLARQIRENNEANQHLLNFSVRHFQNAIDALARSGGPGTYERDGSCVTGENSILLDHTA